MQPIYLIRTEASDEGTFGRLILRGETFVCHTAELPWRDNQRNVSCIPAGTYPLWPHQSPRFGKCYLVKDVPERSHILFHVGNFSGDKSKGYRSDSDGCILPGTDKGTLFGQQSVISSRTAFTRLTNLLGDSERYTLHVIEDIQSGQATV